jgi:ribosome-associated protein
LAKKSKPTLTEIIIDALEDIKAKDIKLINVANITSVSDHVAIASADSNRQTRALATNVMDKVREAGYTIYGSEGEQTGEWVLVDCGDVVVHIMQPAIREYYKLEELWLDGTLEFPKPKRELKAAAEAAKPVASAKSKKLTATKKVAAKKVVAKKIAVKKPSAKKLAAKVPAAKAPAAKKTPAVKKPAATKPSTTKVVENAPPAKKPVAKKPAAKVAKKKTA